MIRNKLRFLFFTMLSLFCLLMLTGCPWGQMKYYPSETASTYMNGDSVCFFIPNAQDYQPVFISINLRSTPPKEGTFTDEPNLTIIDGKLCIPPSFYHLPDTSTGPFIVQLVIESKDKGNHPRHFVLGFEMLNSRAYDVPLTKREYDEPSIASKI